MLEAFLVPSVRKVPKAIRVHAVKKGKKAKQDPKASQALKGYQDPVG